MRRLAPLLPLVCLALLLLLQSAFAAPQQERRVALIIGNSAYKDAPLKNPVNDARDVNAALKKLGFETTLLTDATMQQMESAVREFGLKLRQGGMGLFYYAGHGVQVAGNNYLVPVKAVIQSESDVKYGCLDAGLVLGKMEDAGNGLNVIILDACRNNPFARSFRSADQGLAKMDAPTGSLIAYATSPGRTAADGEGKNGLYTQHHLKSIATPGLSVEELFKRVRQGVAGDSAKKQVPWEASSLIGQFSFAGGEHTASLGPAAPVATAPAPAAKPLDLKAEKKRVADEAAQLKREQNELAQLQALQAEQARLEAARQKLAQAKADAEAAAQAKKQKQLAMAPVPKQAPSAATKEVEGQGSLGPFKPDPTDAPKPGTVWKDPVTGIEYVWVPGGGYEMDFGSYSARTVRLSGFWLGKFEVTQGQWLQIMGKNPSYFKKGDTYPVESVSWNDIKGFISRLNDMGSMKYRLPTEAELQYAARSGGRPEAKIGGYDVDRVAWYMENSGRSTHPVGTKAPNGLGLHDMTGNVSEWCEDTYRANSYKTRLRDNPITTGGSVYKVYIDGDWGGSGGATSDTASPTDRINRIGFRLVRIP